LEDIVRDKTGSRYQWEGPSERSALKEQEGARREQKGEMSWRKIKSQRALCATPKTAWISSSAKAHLLGWPFGLRASRTHQLAPVSAVQTCDLQFPPRLQDSDAGPEFSPCPGHPFMARASLLESSFHPHLLQNCSHQWQPCCSTLFLSSSSNPCFM
jgi:hypothetical protein